MKKFAFTLQSVHKVREFRQEKELMTLSEKQAEMESAQARVSLIEQQRFDAMKRYADRLNSREYISPLEMELNFNHFASLNRLQQEAEAVLRKKKDEFAQQGAVVAAASREVKVTDKLRELQKDKHRRETDREEQNGIDELVSANFARKISRTK